MGVLPGMTAAQATVLVMGGRNVAAKIQGKEGIGLDWETRQLTQLSDEELLALARAEAAGEGESPHQKQDLEVIALLSATNTAVTVMVLGFLYIIGRSRSGATLALKQMYPVDTWSGLHPTTDFIRLLALTIAAGLIIGTILGLMPPRIGIRRSHAMGIIIVPIMIYTFAQKYDAFGFL